MKKIKDVNEIYEQKIIAKCLLKGMNIKQIAQELHCAKSTASYKTRKLFKEYNASDRNEFCINIFSKIIIRYKNELNKLESEIQKYKKTY